MGTPDFAVPSLDILVQSPNHDVVAVITATDKMGGRGKKQLIESAVKKYALANDIDILQPPNLKAKSFVKTLQSYEADLFVVVAFRMLPEVVWNMPPYGTMNLHGSLLPKYRGAAPINWAIIRGEKVTGLTTFLLQHEIDTGDILGNVEVPIDYTDTAGTLHDKMMNVGSHLVLTSVNGLANGNTKSKAQDDSLATTAPKIFSQTCLINPNQDTRSVYNFIRGLNPYPGAYIKWDDNRLLKIFNCREYIASSENAGKLYRKGNELLLSTNDGYIVIDKLQLSGKRRMTALDFLNGLSDNDKAKLIPMQ